MNLSNLGTLALSPPLSPEAWLAAQPSWRLDFAGGDLVLIQPSSTLIVYGLGILTIAMGFRFLGLRRRAAALAGAPGTATMRALLCWGIALAVWGLGTLLAGTSYQAFGYMIKGAGRATMALTSYWEVAYMMLTVASVSSMGVAVAAFSTRGLGGKLLGAWAWISTPAYLAFALVGAAKPDAFMVSFEAMVLFVIPSMLAFFAVNLVAWLRWKRGADLVLLRAWLGMALVMAAYFAAYLGGLGPALWSRGLWFSENDVLHLGLIAWMLYLGFRLAPSLLRSGGEAALD
ncbi:MAG: hypothetical protein ACOYM2_10335 [Rectinemataceae bacterium]